MNAERYFHHYGSFVGREEERKRIFELLAKPECRLLTLVGPGGIGKTRLALQVVEPLAEEYAHGVALVPLQPVTSVERLITTFAEALDLSLSGQEAPREQLFGYLQKKEMLLLLDNLEQIPDAAELLSDLLRLAPGVQVIATSREVLNLQEEWLYPVSGLPVPAAGATKDVESYGAVQLFVARARRVRPHFDLEHEQAGVVRICQLVAGMPLALELAASWLTTLRSAAIAAEIQRSLDFLSTDVRNVPDRHRNIRAVFNQSWKLLSAKQRDAFRRLSVFRGGFRRDAAAAVAGASLKTLSALVDRSLIVRQENGRYGIHELLRQYGAEKLAASPEELAEAEEQHCAYFATFMHERVGALNDGRQIETVSEILAELDNVRAAWERAIAGKKIRENRQIGSTFFFFCQIQSRFLEGADALEEAAVALDALPPGPARDLTLAQLLNHQGWLRIRVGAFDKAEAILSRSRDLFARLSEPPPPYMGGDSAVPLGIVRLIRGEQREAEALGNEARQAAEKRRDDQNLSFAHYLLTSVKLAQGDYEAAHYHAQQACVRARAAGNRWFLAYPLIAWGNVARARGNYEEARNHYQASYGIRTEFDDPEGQAVALVHLGEIAFLQEAYEEASHLYREGLAIYQEINDRGGRAKSLQGLGRVACARQDYDAARQHLSLALDMATAIEFWPLVFSLLLDASELLLQTGSTALGRKLLLLLQDHPQSDHETKVSAARKLADWQEEVGGLPGADALREGEALDLEPVVAQLRSALAEPTLSPAPDESGPQPLVEPLTERELEVLHLMAAGYSNPAIADALTIAVGTVKWYASQIYGKLGVTNRTAAAVRARELDLVT